MEIKNPELRKRVEAISNPVEALELTQELIINLWDNINKNSRT